ncbi:MAG TPA: hypothetical protein VKZ63_13450, partial [Kofleriaceae bacterium]|nr:hypothetical protein [Kofleriaceae bacterium]
FLFRDSVCGELEPRECRCGGMQNSARLLLERLGAGAQPTLWLSAPTGEDPVVQGFVVTAAVTQAPTQVALYVDGELFDRAPPVAADGPYALVDLATFNLSPGGHQLDVVAQWADGSQAQEGARVEVIGGEVGGGVSAGLCSAAGGSGGAPLALTALGWLCLGRRRARRRRRR